MCAYCGCPRREGCGGVAAFRGSVAYRWLLGSLGLDGSEPVEFDNESTDSSKTKEALKNGMVLSDLLDLKLSFPPENKETSGSTENNEQSSAEHMLKLSGVNLDSFFAARMENTTTAAVPTQKHTVVQEKQSTDSHGSSSLEMRATYLTGTKTSSQNTNQIEVTPAFANWDADFQSASSESVTEDSKKSDLFNSASNVKASSFPAHVTAISPVVPSGNETYMRSTKLEDSKDLASASGMLVKDESNSGIFPENNIAEFTESSLSKSSAHSDQLPARGDTGVGIDEAFDDWQEFTGGNQGSLSNAGEHMEGPIESNPSEIKTVDTWPVSSMESSNNVTDNSVDDWQAFTSSSGQGGNSVKPIEGSAASQGGDVVKPVGQTASISFEHFSEANSVELWPVGNINELHNTKVVNETNDSFDDWQDFTTSGQGQGAPSNQVGGMIEVSRITQKETSDDSWFTTDVKEEINKDLVNTTNAMLDDFQSFSGSDLAPQSSSFVSGEMMNPSFGQHEGTDTVQSWLGGSNNMGTNMATTNSEDNSFDIWKDFTTSGHQKENISIFERKKTSTSSEPAKETDPMDLWLTSNAQESNSSKDANRINDSSGGWQDFANFGQKESMKIPGVGHSAKDSSSNSAELKNHEQINEDSDPFDDWQDFKNSHPLDTSLQVPSNSSFDNSLVRMPDALEGLEFGSFAQSVPSQSQRDNKENSNETNTVSSNHNLERMVGRQQTGDLGSLSTIWPTTSHDTQSVSKPESADANVERLLSQMHDLSFMLKDDLSIPDKPVGHYKP